MPLYIFCLQILVHLFKTIAYQIEELVHELGFLHFGNIDHHLLSCPFHPSGFRMRASAAREYEQACIRPVESVKVGLELPFRRLVLQSLLVVFYAPFFEVRIYILPHECSMVVRRIAEIVDLVSEFAEFSYNLRVISVSPAACYIYPCHIDDLYHYKDTHSQLHSNTPILTGNICFPSVGCVRACT